MDNETAAPKKAGSRRIVVMAIIALVVLGAGYLLFTKVPGLSGGASAAVVNGEEIKSSEVESRFNQYKQMYGAQIPNIEDPQVTADIRSRLVQEIVNEVLISQHAQKNGIAVTDEEVTNAMSALKARYESEDAYKQDLKTMGYSENAAREVVVRGLYIEKFLADLTAKENATATEEEVNALYGQVAEGKKDFPPLADVRKDVEDEVKRQKIAQKVIALIDQLKQEATIVLN